MAEGEVSCFFWDFFFLGWGWMMEVLRWKWRESGRGKEIGTEGLKSGKLYLLQ